MYNNAARSYQKVAVNSASREKLLLIAYEGAIRFLKQAILNVERGDIAGKCDRLSRVSGILDELDGSLNLAQGGEVAENLHSLYTYMMLKLVEANAQSDVGIMEEVLSLMQTLHEAWVEIIERPMIVAQAAARSAAETAVQRV